MIDYEKFDIKTLKNLYRIQKENCQRLFAKLKTEEAILYQEVIERDAIENALKKKEILTDKIDIEEISENPLTKEKN